MLNPFDDMNRSKLSNVLSTTRLLPYFSDENVEKVRSCLYQELGCENEAQFVCQILKSIYKRMTNQSIANIKNKVMEIADSQQLQFKYKSSGNDHDHDTTNSSTNDESLKRNMTVYKFVQQQYSDPFSQLHSDIIDYFGTFLSKKQSIEFGYLNKQLFIETQKHSYLLKRCKDILSLGTHEISKIYLGGTDAFSFTFPRRLFLDVSQMNQDMIKQMNFFGNFFRRLSHLVCWNIVSLTCVPLQFLLNKNSNYYPNAHTRSNIRRVKLKLAIKRREDMQDKIDILNSICQNFDNINLDWKDMRCIDKFEWLMPWYGIRDEKMKDVFVACQKLILRFGKISKSIYLERTKVKIDTMDEMKAIFHSKLKHLHLRSGSSIMVNIDNANYDNNNHTHSGFKSMNCVVGGGIETITLESDKLRDDVDYQAAIETLNNLDKFSMRKTVKLYTVIWNKPRNFNSLNIGDVQGLFDKIFFQDYDKNPLLQQITIKMDDDVYLFGLARLLVYFHQHYKELFVERKLYLTHFKAIQVVYERIHFTSLLNRRMIAGIQLNAGHMFDNIQHSEIFQQNRDEEYSIDDKVIQITDIKQGIESFGTIYQNILYWLYSRQAMESTDVDGCKIVFVL